MGKNNRKSNIRSYLLLFVVFLIIVVPWQLGTDKLYLKQVRTSSNNQTLFSVDIVYTYVDGSDVSWQKLKSFYEKKLNDIDISEEAETMDESTAASTNRFRSNNELLYSLRSIEKFAPSIRKIFIVVATPSQVPNWLDTNHPKIQIIYHAEIFQNPDHLPTFNSNAIEGNLNNIPGLSEYFIYFNDDIFLGKQLQIEDFLENGIQKLYVAWYAPSCADECNENDIGDGICNEECNVLLCNFDLGDCDENEAIESQSCFETGCSSDLIGDSICNEACNIKECAFDGGDCSNSLKSLTTTFKQSVVHSSISTYLVLSLVEDISDIIVEYTVKVNNTAVYSSQVIVQDNINYLVLLIKQSSLLKNEIVEVLLSPKNTDPVSTLFIHFDTNGHSTSSNKNYGSFTAATLHTKMTLRSKLPHYKPTQRYNSHAPTFYQKSILNRMKAIFEEEFDITSSHKFRTATDMQFIFSYGNYLISESKSELTASKAFQIFDKDNSGDLNLQELDALRQFDTKFGKTSLPKYAESLVAKTRKKSEISSDIKEISSKSSGIDINSFLSPYFQSHILPNIVKKYNLEKENAVLHVNSPEVSFVMLGNSHLLAVLKFLKVKLTAPKFICINDDVKDMIPFVTSAPEAIFRELKSFYISLFPKASQFEVADSSESKFASEIESQFHYYFIYLPFLFVAFIMFRARCCTAG